MNEPRSSLLIRAQAAATAALEHPAEGRAAAEAVAAEARSAGHAEALVVALRAAGWAARELYEHDAAASLIAEAVEVATNHGLDARLSEVLVTRSTIRLEEGAIDLARRDLADATELASPESRSEVLFAAALLESRSGRLKAAAAAYERAVDAAGDDRPDITAKALNNWGQVCRSLGDLDAADQMLCRVIELAEAFSPMLVAIATHNRAGVAGDNGHAVQALRFYDEAVERLNKAGLPLGEHYLDKAQTLLSLRLLDEAFAAVDLAVVALDGSGGSLLLAEALILRARIALERNDNDAARHAARRAAELLSTQQREGWRARAELLELRARVQGGETGDELADAIEAVRTSLNGFGYTVGVADAELLLGRIARQRGETERAALAFDRAAETAGDGPVFLRLRGRLAGALAAEIRGQPRTVSRLCRAGLDDLERYRATFGSSELRALAANHGIELAEIGLRSALRASRPFSVWAWLEQTRSSVVATTESLQPSEDISSRLAEMRELRRRFGAAGTAEEDLREVTDRLARLESEVRELGWRAGDKVGDDGGGGDGDGGGDDGDGAGAPAPAWAPAPTPATLAELRRSLADRTIVEYAALDGYLMAAIVDRSRVTLAHLGPQRAVDEATMRLGFALNLLGRPRSQASAKALRAGATEALDELDRLLIHPLGRRIDHASEIVIVPPSSLFGLPWGALPTLARRPFRIAPSALLWQATTEVAASSDRVVVVAGPDLEHADPEAAGVSSIYPSTEHLTGAAATCGNVLDRVEGAGLVHLACHGTLRSDSPTFSGFHLADGPLTVHDLERVRRPAHQWVLAACDLGNPGTLSGPDLEGVLASLLGGGAAAVVAAVLPIPDDFAAQLMVGLHRARAGGADLAEALQTARAEIDADDPRAFVAAVAFNCYGGG